MPENLGPELGPENSKERKIVKIASDFKDEYGNYPEIEIDEEAPGEFLFDIDGTLILAEGLHFRALFDAYKNQLPENVNFQEQQFEAFSKLYHSNFGFGLKQAHENICKSLALDPNQINFEMLDAEYDDNFISQLEKMTQEERKKFIIAGAMGMLENIHRLKMPAAIVSGNNERRAKALIKNFGLAKYFLTGAFDEDARNAPQGELGRAYIVNRAIDRLREKGFEYSPEKIIAVGDTPKDFEATFLKGQRTVKNVVLVTSGGRSFAELDALESFGRSPDLVLPELHLSGDPIKDQELLKRVTKRKA